MKTLVKILSNLILESYDPNQLYDREFMVKRLLKAPREIKSYIKNLPKIECESSKGEKRICTKIPEIIHIYLSGRY